MDIFQIEFNSEIIDFVKSNHYTHSCPNNCRVCVGLFEEHEMKGVAIFSDCTRPQKKYTGMLELSRFFVCDEMESNTESMFLSRALNIVEENFPCNGVVSYSDKTEGHDGTIYKACNFVKVGETAASYHYCSADGVRIDKRQVAERARKNDRHEAVQAYIENLIRVPEIEKNIYLMQFNRKIPIYLSPTFSTWTQMKRRCFSEKYRQYSDYGGRGITVCDDWMEFDNFLRDMGARPSMLHTLDRINNDGNYCKENCRWASHYDQNRNTRRNIIIEWNGKSQCLMDWSKEMGIGFQTILNRYNKGIKPPRLFDKSSRSHLFGSIQDKCTKCGEPVYSLKNKLCRKHYKRLERERCAEKRGITSLPQRDGSYKDLKRRVLELELVIRFKARKPGNDYGIYYSKNHGKWACFVYAIDNGVSKKVSFIQFATRDEAFNFRESLRIRYNEKNNFLE